MRKIKIEPLRLNGFTTVNRHQMIPLAREALLKNGGDILDVHFFSNISLCVNFELPANRIRQLQSSLEAIDLQLSAETRKSLASYRTPEADDSGAESSAHASGTLQITFIHNEPDLRIEVPAVPG
jgi:hypothetical protein